MMVEILDNSCTSTGGSNSLDVCVPVRVTPTVRMGDVTVTCNGDPVISSTASCTGCLDSAYTFYVRQNLLLQLPLTFTATAQTEGVYVDCNVTPVDDADPVIIHTSICGDR